MKNKTQKKVSIPRWHNRDTQSEVQALMKNAEERGSLRDAMTDYIRGRQGQLPDGMTPESAVDSIINTANDFTAAILEGRTTEDIKSTIKETVAELDSQQAITYLATLELTFRTCDIAVSGGEVPDPETLKSEIVAISEGATDENVIERIEKLAEMIMGDSLNAYVYASGNDEIVDLIRNQNIQDEGITNGAASMIHEMLLDKSKKAELYAATACVCYGMVLDGKIKGMSADDFDAGILTALVSAGMEKASILTRLARGEIDKELVVHLLSILAKALKWILMKAIQGMVFLTATFASILAVKWVIALLGIAFSGWALLSIGCMMGILAVFHSEEYIEDLFDAIGELSRLAKEKICSALSWCWEKLGEVDVEYIDTTYPSLAKM